MNISYLQMLRLQYLEHIVFLITMVLGSGAALMLGIARVLKELNRKGG